MEEGRMSVDSDEGEMIINEVDGLPNLHPNYNELDLNQVNSQKDAPQTIDDLVNDEDLPTSLIVTNLDPQVFKNDDLKKKIERLFSQFGEPLSCQYFRSFRRMRVNFSSPAAAANARIQLHQTTFLNNVINCYFAQPVTPIDSADVYLQPPALTKQFLISPPASPPIGWEPKGEAEPLVNYELLSAIANLTPEQHPTMKTEQVIRARTVEANGMRPELYEYRVNPTFRSKHVSGRPTRGTHELHAPSENQPGIVVHVCEETQLVNTDLPQKKIQHTRCPQY